MKFSVIIPTYNRAYLIKKAIESVFSQSYKDFELIIVDDASSDNIEEVIRLFDDNRIKLIVLENNLGNAGARNRGVVVSKGDYIVFLDSDDEFKENILETFVNIIDTNPDVKFAFGDREIYNTSTKETKIVSWTPNPKNTFLHELKIGIGCGVMVKKSVFKDVGYFDERLRVAVDTDWLIRLDKVVNFVYYPQVLIRINDHTGQRVRKNKNELIKSYEIILEKNYDEIISDNKLFLKFFYKLQRLNYQEENIFKGNKYAKQIIINNIFSFKPLVIFILYNLLPIKLAKYIHLSLGN